MLFKGVLQLSMRDSAVLQGLALSPLLELVDSTRALMGKAVEEQLHDTSIQGCSWVPYADDLWAH